MRRDVLRREAGSVTTAVYPQPLARFTPPECGTAQKTSWQRGAPLPASGACAGQGRKAATEAPKLCGRVQEATLFWGRVGRQASRRGVAGCPRRRGCGGDRRTDSAGSSAQGAGVPPPSRDAGEREATIMESRGRSLARGWTREGKGQTALLERNATQRCWFETPLSMSLFRYGFRLTAFL